MDADWGFQSTNKAVPVSVIYICAFEILVKKKFINEESIMTDEVIALRRMLLSITCKIWKK